MLLLLVNRCHTLGLHASYLRGPRFLDDGLSVEELIFLHLSSHLVDASHNYLVHLLSDSVGCLEVAIERRRRQVPLSVVGDPSTKFRILGRWARSLQCQLALLLGRHGGLESQLE